MKIGKKITPIKNNKKCLLRWTIPLQLPKIDGFLGIASSHQLSIFKIVNIFWARYYYSDYYEEFGANETLITTLHLFQDIS